MKYIIQYEDGMYECQQVKGGAGWITAHILEAWRFDTREDAESHMISLTHNPFVVEVEE